jgi:outer membrane receptor protein involved in Fe transport
MLSTRLRGLCTASATAISVTLFAAPAFAQGAPGDCAALPQGAQRDACLGGNLQLASAGQPAAADRPAAAEQPAAADQGAAIVVTGSRIRRPNLESTVPITSLTGEQFFQQGETNVGETLNDLPQLRNTFSQSNPGLGIGITGLNLLDLRGLGPVRTLVLVNGRRHVASDLSLNAGGATVDVNTIPNDLIERVDIVTGGNSAIYGSDAIAGVVNFVLRRDFQGFQMRAQAGVAEHGYGPSQYVSAMYGTNFAGGRGNITVHGEYYRQERIFASDIPEYRTQNGFFTVDADSGGLANNSDGFPDRVFLRDVRSTTISPYGLVAIVEPTGAGALCGTGTLANNGGPNSAGTPFNCTYLWTPDGRLTQQTGARFGSGPTGGILGGNGATGREANTFGVLPHLDRYNFNLLAHYAFSPAFEAFLEAKYTRITGFGRNAGPSFIQGQTTQFDERERPRLDNPFINPADRTTLTNLILASGFEPRLVARRALNGAGNCTTAQVVAGTCRFDLARNLLDAGLRDEYFTRDTFRIVGGLRGTFNDDWSYEISANYGRFDEDTTIHGAFDRQRFVLAMDAGRNPVTGQIQCRAQFDPASARAFDAAPYGGGTRTNPSQVTRLAADIAACVPYDPFGAGGDNRASVDYFTRQVLAGGWIKQLVLSGFVSGDTSGFFNLWGGPIRFAVGGEYRRQDQFYDYDDFAQEGLGTNTNSVVGAEFSPAAFEVKEAFAELQLPILRDAPFFHELTLSGAARYASYNGSTGTVWAYNAGVDWAPVRDLRFRANYSRAVRAPNLAETGRPRLANFSNGFVDPCQPASINGTANRARNCQADLGALLANLTDITASLPIFSGSNPNLAAESSDSWTAGGVFQPRFIPGLSLSVDYYNITVNDIITPIVAQTIVNSCYDLPDLNNVFCSQFQRNRGPGNGPLGEVPGRILGNTLTQAPLNYARRQRVGIDVNLNYRVNLGAVRLQTGLIYTHNLKISDYVDPTQPEFEDRILGELGDPMDEFRFDMDLSFGPFLVGYQMHFIGPMYANLYEDTHGLNAGLNGATPPGGGNADWSEPGKYPAITYHNIRFEWNLSQGNAGIGRDLRFYFGVDNVLNQYPPLGATGTGAFSSIYDYRGRSFYAGFRARF